MCNSCLKDNNQIYILIFKAFHLIDCLHFLGDNESKILQKFMIDAYIMMQCYLEKWNKIYYLILTADSYKFSKKIKRKKNNYFTVNILYKHKYYYFFAVRS